MASNRFLYSNSYGHGKPGKVIEFELDFFFNNTCLNVIDLVRLPFEVIANN